MESLSQFFASDLSLWGLFISSLLGATLLPGGSELVLIGTLKAQPELFWTALLIGTLGNTLGGMVSFGMGWMLPQFRHGGAEHSGAVEAAEHPNHQPDKLARNAMRVQKYGTPVLLFAWLPFIGDALCIAAGWLRLNPWQAIALMAAGKFARYIVIASGMQTLF